MRRILTVIITLALGAILTGPAWAGPGDHLGFRGWGPRVGLSSSPDQVHLGFHMDLGNFAEHFRLQPNLEVGVGSGRTLTAFNLETSYRFSTAWGNWSPYAGGGLGFDIVHSDSWPGRSDENLGASALGGIEESLSNGDRFFLETKLGLAHAPDIKFTVGWTFY